MLTKYYYFVLLRSELLLTKRTPGPRGSRSSSSSGRRPVSAAPATSAASECASRPGRDPHSKVPKSVATRSLALPVLRSKKEQRKTPKGLQRASEEEPLPLEPLEPFRPQASSARQRRAARVTAVSGRSHSAARAKGQNLTRVSKARKHLDPEISIPLPLQKASYTLHT